MNNTTPDIILQKENINRERRLRYAAAKKGLFIRKRKWRLYYSQFSYDEYDGYMVGSCQYNVIILGGDSNGMHLPTLEDAEDFVYGY